VVAAAVERRSIGIVERRTEAHTLVEVRIGDVEAAETDEIGAILLQQVFGRLV